MKYAYPLRSPFYLTCVLQLIIFFFLNSSNCMSTYNSSSSPLVDKLILDCGFAGNSSFNNKTWVGDVNYIFPDIYYEGTKIGRVISNVSGKVPENPYSTARFFPSSFTYSFPMPPGLKFIRLHFYPTSYNVEDQISKANFSVTSGNFTLLNNFSPLATANTLNSPYFTKDYFLNLKKDFLNITFAPSLHASSKAFAFVNGIEVYSMPLKLYDYGVRETSNAASNVQDEPAIEILYRINVGSESLNEPFWYGLNDKQYIQGSQKGTDIRSYDDHIELFEYSKSSWTLSEYGAPEDLYTTARTIGSSNEAANAGYNLTWTFQVDSGFYYIVRLHFCEIQLNVTEVNQRVFTVYINNQIVENSLDVVGMSGGPLVAMHKDYIKMVREGKEARNDLLLALQPHIHSKSKLTDVILNGIEIMKLSDTSNNLAAHLQLKHGDRREKISMLLRIVLGSVFGIFLLTFPIRCCILQCYTQNPGKTNSLLIVETSDRCRQFSLEEIKAATINFSEALLLGRGGFGKVYLGVLEDGITKVAVKRNNPKYRQGVEQFKTEIELLSAFRHMNIVSLLGYCQEDKELILIYDYMSHGSLRDHLYGFESNKPPLSWTQRLKICIGAARGLHYLHTGTEHSIIHRDIKSSNILLDQHWVAKVSDFGLSKVGTETAGSFKNQDQVSPGPKGTFGYLDPEYGTSRILTHKTDVYSFGVVLLEVLCAKPALNPEANGDDLMELSLARWALQLYRRGDIDLLIEPHLRGKIMSECLTMFVDTAVRCLAAKQIHRPSIGDVLCKLEQALLLQEADSNLQIKLDA